MHLMFLKGQRDYATFEKLNNKGNLPLTNEKLNLLAIKRIAKYAKGFFPLQPYLVWYDQ